MQIYNYFNQRKTLFILLLLISLSMVRFLFLGYSSLRYDEMHNLVRSVEYNYYTKNIFLSFIKYTPSQFFHFLSVKALGTNEFANRLPVVIQSFFIVLFTYLIAKSLFNRKSAVIAAFISLILPYNYAYARYAQYDIGQLFFFIIGAYFFLCNDKYKIKNNILSSVFFGLALVSKHNSIILQVIIYTTVILTSDQKKIMWKYIWLNFFSFLVFIIIYKMPNLFDFAMEIITTAYSITHKSSGITGEPFFLRLYFICTKLIIIFTIPFILILIYSGKNFFRNNIAKKNFMIIFLLYSIALLFQGRLGTRYFNLIVPFVIILISYEISNINMIDMNKLRITTIVIFILCFFLQISVSYNSYYKWEKCSPPLKEIGNFFVKEVEPVGSRIFLPQHFKTCYLGIMQLGSLSFGSRYPIKGELYHINYSPYNFNEQSIKNSKMLLKEWLIENKKDIFLLKISRLKENFKKFLIKNENSNTIQKALSFKELINNNILKQGDVIFLQVKGYDMYPVLWPMKKNNHKLDNKHFIATHEILKTFNYKNSENLYAYVVKIK